jgi:L-ascorbate metabolism protein UlaG (beta-lactamase superfamily)
MTISIRWFVRSWVQIKDQDEVIYIDPAYIRAYFTACDPIGGQPESLGKANLILVTHPHKSHCKRETTDALRGPNTVIIAPENCAEVLGDVSRVIRPGERVTYGDVTVRAVPAYNTPVGHSTEKLHPKGFGIGYLITIAGRTIYHAGDTDFIPEMCELDSVSGFGGVDVALLPIDGTFTMDVAEAVEAVVAIKPRVVIPIHRLDADPGAFVDAVAAVFSCEVVPLRVGGVYEV